MFTVLSYAQSVLSSGTVQSIDAVSDQSAKVNGKFAYIPKLNQMVAYGGAFSSAVSESYFRAPSLRRIANLYVGEMNNSQIGAKVGQRYLLSSPIALDPSEGLEFLSDGGGDGTTPQQVTAYVVLADGVIAPVNGEIFTIKATASIASVAGAWSNGSISFAQSLPVGHYQIVGARCESPSGVAFRFVPIGAANRPGGVCMPGDGIEAPRELRMGRMGVWTEFDTETPPSLDILTSGSDTAQTLYIDLIRTK